ncbi:hypothetical protein K505DRAFT_241388 [Melanomma pulvis-pyrius CBS 109.77]|uniref:Capsule polysaccharide biosynthesis protein n=1 Tax=Melanomma pulvis-pyrius CBS 109.77 TaxID=1314802 RepID=A0A6A6XDW6_9PLEO|nr:hypothetical protein K505DRAFT_241388 [Melanomma pulvis-pyrius CBS 109.77]
MAGSRLTVPSEFQSHVRYVESKDKRTDAEIIESLSKNTPITSEKNVWTYWHSGVKSMPSWCQRNIINWVRLLGPDWTVRVLDTALNSANHALSWISPEELPESFVKGTMTGPYVGPHSADFLRGAALYAYGGVWMDVGNLLFRHLDKICWDQLADDSSPFTVSTPWMFGHHMANHFIAARKGDMFIRKWHDLFMHFWKGRQDYTGIIESPLIGFVKDFNFAEAEARGFKWDFKIDELTVLGYIGQVVAWVRLCWLQEPNGGFNGVEYYCNKVLLFDVLTEDWPAETVVGFDGQSLFNVFTTKLDDDPESEEYKKAYEATWLMLTKSCLQKITHAKGITKDLACGMLLDKKENERKDGEPGTFGELLRYGSVHLEQTRERINYVDPIRPEEKVIIHKGLLEP